MTSAIVDCEQPENKELCYTEHGLPPSPHRPVLKAWPRVKELGGDRGLGEQLFDVTVLESHLALELLERALRLALAPEAGDDALTAGDRSAYDEEKEEEEEEPPNSDGGGGAPPPRPKAGDIAWEGRPALQWEGPDGHQSRPIAVEAWQGPRFEHSQLT